MANDYSKFFSTYEAVEPPKYTKLNMEKYTKFNKKSIDNPYFHYSRTPAPVYNFVFNNEQDDEQNDELSNVPDIIPNFGSFPSTNNNDAMFNFSNFLLTNNNDNRPYYLYAFNLFKSNTNNSRQIANQIYNALWKENNWDDLKISAMLGNIIQESSFLTSAKNTNSSAHGLFQMLDSTYNAFKKWDNNHPKYKEKYPEYVRQALYIADAFDNHDTSVIFHEETRKLRDQGKYDEADRLNLQGWADWNSGDLTRMSNAFRCMWGRSGKEDGQKTNNKRAAYSAAAYNILTR